MLYTNLFRAFYLQDDTVSSQIEANKMQNPEINSQDDTLMISFLQKWQYQYTVLAILQYQHIQTVT